MPPDGFSNHPVSPGSGKMQRFVADFLAREGALVEPVDPEALDVLVPPPMQAALDVPEMCRLGFGASLPDGALRVGIESDWLGRLSRLLGERGRAARLVLNPDARAPREPERLLEQELPLDNATFRFLGMAPAWTRYLILDFRYSAVSEEKRDGVVRLIVNLATGAMPDALLGHIARRLADDSLESDLPDASSAVPDQADLPPLWDIASVRDLVARALRPRLDTALAPFVKGLHRRLGRDQERLYSYHNDLHREVTRRAMALPDGDPGRKREAQRIEAVAREYQAKLDDLTRQYAMRVSVEWVQTLELAMPVQRLNVQIRRRKESRTIALDWNMLARRLEPPSCEFSRSGERPRLVCDDALHLVAPSTFSPCAGCEKQFCRACHPARCPKCGFLAPSGGGLLGHA